MEAAESQQDPGTEHERVCEPKGQRQLCRALAIGTHRHSQTRRITRVPTHVHTASHMLGREDTVQSFPEAPDAAQHQAQHGTALLAVSENPNSWAEAHPSKLN